MLDADFLHETKKILYPGLLFILIVHKGRIVYDNGWSSG